MKILNSATLMDEAIKRADALRQDEHNADEMFQWLAESPRHVEELLLAQEVLDEIAALTPEKRAVLASLREGESATEGTSANVIPLDNTTDRVALAPSMRRRLRSVWWSVAAGLLAILAGASIWQTFGWRTYSTAVGEQHVVELVDGSTVHLNTSSKLQVRFTSEVRELHLVSGEALFKVRHESARPFQVIAGGTTVQAVGTQFNVYRSKQVVKVSVLEGVVQVSGGKSSPQRIAANQTVSVDRIGHITSPKPLDEVTVAWRERRLVFRGNSLSEIAAEFNRYNRSPQIRIVDVQAGKQRFVGTFDADAPEALMEALALNQTLTARRVGNDILVQTRR